MKLFIVENSNASYDTNDGGVICADNIREALQIALSDLFQKNVRPSDITHKEIGESNSDVEKGIVFISYRAG